MVCVKSVAADFSKSKDGITGDDVILADPIASDRPYLFSSNFVASSAP